MSTGSCHRHRAIAGGGEKKQKKSAPPGFAGMGCSRHYPGPFIPLVPAGSLAPAPWMPPFLGGLLAQPLRLDANSRGDYSASHGEEENIPVLGTESSSATLTKSSPMVWTKLQRFCTDGCRRVW